MKNRTYRILAGVMLLLAGGAGVWAMARGKPGPASTLPEELQPAAFQAASAGQPGELEKALREAMQRDDLTEEQRRELRGNMRELMESMMQQRVEEYFAAAPEDKDAVLDRHLDDFQQRMQYWRELGEQRRRERESRPEAERQAEDEERREEWARRRGSQTSDQRQARVEGRNPDQMARTMAYFTAMRKRADARGISMPMWGSGGGPRRGGPGSGRP